MEESGAGSGSVQIIFNQEPGGPKSYRSNGLGTLKNTDVQYFRLDSQ
jgi:hypothetical protein